MNVSLSPGLVTVNGPLGELQGPIPRRIGIEQADAQLLLKRPTERGEDRALHGLARTLVANMVEGVTTGFKKQLDIVGVGYKAETRPYGLQLALGFSHPVEYRAPKGIKLTAPQPTQIVIEGADKELVGQVAAELRSLRPPEPYKGKGIKYQGEQIRRKAGKAGAK